MQNWAGNVTYSASEVARPGSMPGQPNVLNIADAQPLEPLHVDRVVHMPVQVQLGKPDPVSHGQRGRGREAQIGLDLSGQGGVIGQSHGRCIRRGLALAKRRPRGLA